jgi:hypothetical protein
VVLNLKGEALSCFVVERSKFGIQFVRIHSEPGLVRSGPFVVHYLVHLLVLLFLGMGYVRTHYKVFFSIMDSDLHICA